MQLHQSKGGSVGRHAFQPEDVATPKAPYSPVIVSGDLVVTAGQVAFDVDGNVVGDTIEAQTRQTLENVGRCLAAAGCGLEDVIKVNAFITDMANFAGFNAVYREYFTEPYPVRTTVQAGLAPGLLIEIEGTARKSG
jgi:2-iminobutanoate/2-iminopropanoate deaminase